MLRLNGAANLHDYGASALFRAPKLSSVAHVATQPSFRLCVAQRSGTLQGCPEIRCEVASLEYNCRGHPPIQRFLFHRALVRCGCDVLDLRDQHCGSICGFYCLGAGPPRTAIDRCRRGISHRRAIGAVLRLVWNSDVVAG